MGYRANQSVFMSITKIANKREGERKKQTGESSDICIQRLDVVG